MRLSTALDQEVLVATQKFLANGVPADVPNIYAAVQKSNSSLKRQQKKTIQASIERVLEFIGAGDDGLDSEAAIDDLQQPDPVAELMNKSLRANLSSRPANPPAAGGDETPRRRKINGEPVAKRQKRVTEDKSSAAPPMDVSLEDVGGMGDIIAQMNERIIMPIGFYEEFDEAKFPMPKGILLHGPPGCGKTMLCRAYAAELRVPFIEILGPSIVSGMSGESEKAVREKFDEAKKNAPCLVFIDEIDAIAPKRETSQSQMEKRIVAQLLVSMDDLQSSSKPVIVLAATNRPDSLDPALRRGGRFGTEININVPNEEVRQRILQTQTREMKVGMDVDFAKLAKMTGGFVGADLHDLVGKAAAHQMKRLQNAMEMQAVDLALPFTDSGVLQPEVLSARRLLARIQHRELPRPAGFDAIALAMEDFTSVLPFITPSSKREGFTTIPDVSWKDIGALESVRAELQAAIIAPIATPGIYEHFGMDTPSGVLLWGPPGCGKTLLAKAAAAESKANFISIKGPELLNKFVGESEAAVRKVFQRARSSIPCVIFFDELDALVPKRDDSASEASSRVVNTLLTELDGLSVRTGIYVIAATNRPDMIDEAMLRPGRLGTTLFVDLPGPEERIDILKALVGSKPCDFTEEIRDVVARCDGYSGADVGALLREATLHAIQRGVLRIELVDFTYATGRVKGSVKDVKKYHRLKTSFGQR